jgi:hypothetical protein
MRHSALTNDRKCGHESPGTLKDQQL